MSAGVEVGARSTRKGAKLHPADGCYWSSLPLVGETDELTTRNAHDVCRSVACRKAIRTALDTAQAANRNRCANNHRVVMAKIETEGRLTALVNLFRTDAEIAYEVELLSRPVASAEVETKPEISKLGEFAVSLGAKPNASQPHPITRRSQRRRLALANSFAHAA